MTSDKQSPADIVAAVRARIAADPTSQGGPIMLPLPEPPPVAESGCWNCRFQRDGECRFGPPVAILMPNGTVETIWPEVLDGDWCREHVEVRHK